MSDALKEMAGRAAADLVEDGMAVGLGTGSTSVYAIRRLGERVRDEGLAIVGIPTSVASERLARECGITLTTFDATPRLDIAIDGADEVDPSFHLTKGGGGALLREKVVAACASRVVIIVDPSKMVAQLGKGFAIPVEVVPFAERPVAVGLAALGGEPMLRRTGDASYVTDNGNWILDTRFPGGIADPPRMERAIDEIPGVVEVGLFCSMVTKLIIGRSGRPEIRDVKNGQP